MQLLQDAFDAATARQEGIVTPSRNNLRRTIHTIVTRAGMTPWSDVFQTLRRSRATEWKQTHPGYAVDARLSHSVRVSEKHYMMIPDALWERVGGIGMGDQSEGAARDAKVLL